VKKRILLFYLLFFLLTLITSPWIGPEKTSPAEVSEFVRGKPSSGGEIFWNQRLPRVILGLLAGGTLALVGACFQVLFHNPLVEPFTLGVSGGAALGAFTAMSFPPLWIVWGPFSSVQFFAVFGAAGSLFLIFLLSRRPQGMAVQTLLLAGVTISIICGGIILLLTYIASPNLLVVFQRWMMGGINVIGYKELGLLFPFLVPGLGLLFLHSTDLNHLTLGEELALGHGVAVKTVQRNVFIGGGLAAAAVVSLVGPIGFVGLIIPHAVRRISGTDHRSVALGSFLLGGAVLAWCDTLARILFPPTELPVGIITAVVGGPLFIRLLVSRSPKRGWM
jgi:iron complex transport system permease protein